MYIMKTQKTKTYILLAPNATTSPTPKLLIPFSCPSSNNDFQLFSTIIKNSYSFILSPQIVTVLPACELRGRFYPGTTHMYEYSLGSSLT